LSSSSTTGSADIQMASSQGLVVTASIPEAQIGSIKLGDPVAMVFNAFPNSTFVGLVNSLPVVATTTSNVTTYPIKVSLTGNLKGISSGMNADLTIVTAEATNAIEVPTTAIVSAGSRSFVRTLDAKNTEALTPVQTGVSDATYTQIVGGLSVGQRIVVPTTSGSATTSASGTGARGGGFGGGGFPGGGLGGGVRIGG
jgi:hypothetical protein